MHIVLYLAEAFLAAYLMRLVASRFGVPAVSGYVVGGVLLGGTFFIWTPGTREFYREWLLSENALEQLSFVTYIAMGTIALIIGAELEWKKIRKMGISIIAIAVCEASGAFAVVSLAVWLLTRDAMLAFLLGAVSSATAPAATVAVIQQYRAKGPLTNTILAVVGIDDAISFMIFAFVLTFVTSLLGGTSMSLASGVLVPLLEIALSLGVGLAVGFIGAQLTVRAKDPETVILILGSVVLWTTAATALMDVSELLANMAAGACIVNVYPQLKSKIRSSFSSFLPLFYAMFFIIGGAHLDLTQFPSIWLLAVVYFFARSAGKFGGAYIGSWAGGANPVVRRWIGLDLLPQVGAAVALALVLKEEFSQANYGIAGEALAGDIINVLLITTLLTEFIGPYLTKISLLKAGEAREWTTP